MRHVANATAVAATSPLKSSAPVKSAGIWAAKVVTLQTIRNSGTSVIPSLRLRAPPRVPVEAFHG
jgi:hypothetical protein